MAHFTFDERETDQLYVAAKEFGAKLLKARKDALTLHLSSPALAEIDDQIQRNTSLRTILNPRAEEEARAAARRKRGERVADPRQLDLEQEIKVAAEPNGKKKRKRVSTARVVEGLDVANPEAIQEPDDEFLLGQLKRAGVDIPQGIVDMWTSSERDSALTWAQTAIAHFLAHSGQVRPGPIPVCVWDALWKGRYDFDPRAGNKYLSRDAIDYWAERGPITLDEIPAVAKGGKPTYSVPDRDGKRGALYRGKNHLAALTAAAQANRDWALGEILTRVSESADPVAGDGWTGAKPPKLDDVSADKVHTAATEAR